MNPTGAVRRRRLILSLVDRTGNIVRSMLYIYTKWPTLSIHGRSEFRGLHIPSPQAARIALRAQQIVAYAPGVARKVDCLAGAYFMEPVTDDLAAARSPRDRVMP